MVSSVSIGPGRLGEARSARGSRAVADLAEDLLGLARPAGGELDDRPVELEDVGLAAVALGVLVDRGRRQLEVARRRTRCGRRAAGRRACAAASRRTMSRPRAATAASDEQPGNARRAGLRLQAAGLNESSAMQDFVRAYSPVSCIHGLRVAPHARIVDIA